MTVDREQIRRDAEYVGGVTASGIRVVDAEALGLARHCLALLAELEQAERERDEARDALDEESTPFQNAYNAACERADEAEARLAKVPALVEAVHWALINLNQILDTGNPLSGLDSLSLATAAHTSLSAALEAWEAE